MRWIAIREPNQKREQNSERREKKRTQKCALKALASETARM
jgi:hypothetical protein